MKKVISIVSLLVLCSCAMPVSRHLVKFDRTNVKLPVTRSEKYKKCIIDFSREGIKQSLIKELCDGTYGSLD